MLGIAQGMVRDLEALAMTKTPRASASSLKESPVFQSQFAVLEARLRAARAYLHTTLDEIWDKVEAARELPIEERANHKLATTYVINQGVEIATEAYRAAGQTAIFPTNPVRAAPARCLVCLAADAGPAVQLHHHRPRPAGSAARHDTATVGRPGPVPIQRHTFPGSDHP